MKKTEHTSAETVLSPQQQEIVVHKNSIDRRSYRYRLLPNGLKVILISDPEADISAAALSVRVGQFHDPIERQGLAHFLEHMLFLGTEKYPTEGEYRKFVTENGGRSNAGTGQERTSYFFSIQKEAFAEGLDRFGQFFIAPTLAYEFVQRERNAVNSEYQLKKKEDARRYREVRRKTSNPKHPFYKFSVGNLDTLSDEKGSVWEEVRSFYEQHYSADKMNLVIFSSHSLDELEQMAEQIFHAVPQHDALDPLPVPILLPSQLQQIVSLQSLKNTRTVVLQFPAPSLRTHFGQPIDSVLLSLLGDEGESSLAATLKHKGWAEELYASDEGSDDHILYSVRMTLTEEGYRHWEDVVQLAMAYIRLVLASDIGMYYQEHQKLEAVRFAFAEAKSPATTVNQLAQTLHNVPPQHVLDHNQIHSPLVPQVLAEQLSALTLSNMRIMLMAPDITGDRIEELYDTSYRIDAFTEEQLNKWQTDPVETLAVPKPNAYIPNHLVVQDLAEVSIPQKIWSEEGFTLWHHPDTSFHIPKIQSNIDVSFVSTPKQKWIQRIWVDIVEKMIEKDAYPQQQAGSRMRVERRDTGVRLHVNAFTEFHSAMNSALINTFFHEDMPELLFALVKQEHIESIQNRKRQRPFNQVLQQLNDALHVQSMTEQEILSFYEQLTYAEFLQHRKELMAAAHLEMLAYGNISAEEAKSWAAEMRTEIGALRPQQKESPHIFVPTESVNWQISIDHHDSVYVRYLQGRNPSIREQARYLLYAHLIKAPFFTELRTKQQLGYIVSAAYARQSWLPAIRFGIQSSNTHPDELEQRVQTYLATTQEWIKNMSDADFQEAKEGLQAQLRTKDNNMSERMQRWSEHIDLGMESFDRKQQIADQLQGIHQREMEIFVGQSIYNAPALTIKSVGSAHVQENEQPSTCTDIDCVRSHMTKIPAQ